MKIYTRKTKSFIDLKVDKIEDSIFYYNEKEIEDTIDNLLDVIVDIASYNDNIDLIKLLKNKL